MTKSKLLEMNNVGIVVESLDKAISFFSEIGFRYRPLRETIRDFNIV